MDKEGPEKFHCTLNRVSNTSILLKLQVPILMFQFSSLSIKSDLILINTRILVLTFPNAF